MITRRSGKQLAQPELSSGSIPRRGGRVKMRGSVVLAAVPLDRLTRARHATWRRIAGISGSMSKRCPANEARKEEVRSSDPSSPSRLPAPSMNAFKLREACFWSMNGRIFRFEG